ncbi:hypothetical protein LCGC14_1308870 [marine sediment metagenome]|uniref:Uncharacterized protein n=1 Tax=marine sediment metagenome TaxID=412755 RepID=A0A0F9KNG3_9ZZZZ
MPNAQSVLQEVWRLRPHTYAQVCSRGRWQPYKHLVHIARLVSDRIIAGGARILVNCPPRYGKSEFLSFWLPMWILDNFPERRVILSSYGQQLATFWGRKVRNEMASNDLCRTELAEDSKSVSLFHTPEGGGMMCAGVGTGISGFGMDIGLIDDPIKDWAKAHSEVTLEVFRDWFGSTFYTRLEPGASIIVLMTRWHERDPTGWLLDDHADDWLHIRLPELAEEDDPLGRAIGDPLCPERFSQAAVEAKRDATPTSMWGAIHQQAPIAFGEGRTYRNFGETNIVEHEVEPSLPIQVSVDFNYVPFMHVVLGQHDKTGDMLVAVDEIAREEIRDSQAAGRATGLWIRKHADQCPEVHLFGDVSGAQGKFVASESAWQAFERAMRTVLPDKAIRKRLPRGAPPIADSLEAMHDAMRDARGKSHYHVSRKCARLITDFRDMRTSEGALIDKHSRMLSHASDAERYRMHYLRPVMEDWDMGTGRILIGAGG